MKVYLIKACEKSYFKDYKKYMGAPPQNIFSAAACTPSGIDIEMTDETVDMKVDFRTDADLIAIFMSTPDANRAYEIAEKFSKKGKTVVFGGLHPTFMPEEALKYGEAVMIGEVEEIWEELLKDFRHGSLKSRYKRATPFDLSELKPYPTNIISPDKYGDFWSVVVGRGCVNSCSYCTVNRFFTSMRYRPVKDVVQEIKWSGAEYIELHADNLTADRDYALELFRALKPLNIKWAGETTLSITEDEELLKAAAESGCIFLLIGIETPSRAALSKAGKGFLSVDKVKEQVARLKAHNIAVDSAFLFGFDEHTEDIFRETYKFASEIGIDSMHSVVLIPFPGTELYKKLDSEGRILTKDWSKYNGVNVVFRPAGMSVKELEIGSYWFYRQTSRMGKNFVGKEDELFQEYYGKNGNKFNHVWLFELSVIGAAVLINTSWAWGSLFLIWVLTSLFTGYTGLFSYVSKSSNPFSYWVMTSSWAILSLISFIPLKIF